MEKTFRDILAQFLEGHDDNFTSGTATITPESDTPPYVFEPLWRHDWRPDFAQNPSRARMSGYRTLSAPVTPQPKKTPPPPAPEVLIPLEKLAADELARVRELIALGATDLTQGLSLKRLKKAHRQLVRKYHPDRLPAGSSSAKFMTVQAAYKRLLPVVQDK